LPKVRLAVTHGQILQPTPRAGSQRTVRVP
jgi:hypothetical protein